MNWTEGGCTRRKNIGQVAQQKILWVLPERSKGGQRKRNHNRKLTTGIYGRPAFKENVDERNNVKEKVFHKKHRSDRWGRKGWIWIEISSDATGFRNLLEWMQFDTSPNFHLKLQHLQTLIFRSHPILTEMQFKTTYARIKFATVVKI